MIKSNELRVGNLLNYDTAENDIVVATIDWQDIQWISQDPKGFNLVHSPIPLAEEWWVKFGAEVYEFDNGQANQYRIKDDLFVIRDGIICHYGTSVKLEYVHALQNLYFALRGEELEEAKGGNNE